MMIMNPMQNIFRFGPEPGRREKQKPAPDVEVDVDTLEEEEEKEDEQENTPWRVILFNDEEHTFDEVIGQLIKATGCSHSKAEELTMKVHNEGKALVYEGSFEECFEVNSILKEIELITEIKG